MVNIQFISLIPVLLIIYLLTGCAISPFAPRTPAQVEDRSRPAEHLPTDKTGKIEKQQAPEPVTESVIKTPVAEKVEAVPITKPVQEKANPAVVALLDNADQYTATGQNNKAVASLERAIRIEPKNPVLWHRLGTLHLQGGNWVQAIAMAKKSNVLATNDRSLQAKNWLLIAKARDSLGDTTGSEQAREMARQLQN